MKIIQKNWYLFMVLSICFSQEVLPLTQRYFHTEDMGVDYSRGTYLIVLANTSLQSILEDEDTGDFIHFKKTQGYNVHIVDINDIGVNKDALREYLSLYNAAALPWQTTDPLLEYVLLVGDVIRAAVFEYLHTKLPHILILNWILLIINTPTLVMTHYLLNFLLVAGQ